MDLNLAVQPYIRRTSNYDVTTSEVAHTFLGSDGFASHILLAFRDPVTTNDGIFGKFGASGVTSADTFYANNTVHLVPMEPGSVGFVMVANSSSVRAYISPVYISLKGEKMGVQGFTPVPGAGESISATTTSQTVTFSAAEAVGRNYLLVSVFDAASSAAGAHISTGTGVIAAAATDFFVPVNQQMVIAKPPSHDAFAARTNVGTATVLVIPGDLAPGS